jgi:hypothetical protein
MNRTGNWARRGLRNGLLACLGVFAVLAASDAAWADRQRSEFQRLYGQALVNVLRQYRPDYADRLERRLARLEEELENRTDLTDEQKDDARERVIERQLDAARADIATADQVGTDEQKRNARHVGLILFNFKTAYLGHHTADGLRGRDGARILFIVEVQQEYERLYREAQEAHRQAEQQHDGDEQSSDEQSSSPTLPGNSFYVLGQVGHADGPGMPFFALESFPGVIELGAVKFEPQGTQTGFQAGGRVKIADNASPLHRDRVFFGFNFFQNGFDDSQSLGNLFTNGAGLGIPGTGDPNSFFPAGVFLPHAGGLNTVDNLFGNFDFNTIGGGVAVGTVFDVGNGITVAPFAGVEFASINQDTRVRGQIPGFNLDFVYNTNVNAFQVSPNVGAEVIIPLIVNPDGGPGPNVALQVIPRVFVDTLFFDGSDRLDLSGIVNDAQQVNLGGSESNFGFSLEANVIVQRIFDTPVNLIVGGFVQQRQLVSVIDRSGEVGEKSKASAGGLFSAGASFGAEIPF